MIYCKPCFSSCRRNSSFVDQVKIRLISQLIKGFQEFSKSYLSIVVGDFRGILILNLNDSEFVKIRFGSTL